MGSGMEIIETAGLTIMFDTMNVKRDYKWRSLMDEGIWLGVVVEGLVEVDHTEFGNHIWQKGQMTIFKSEEPSESCHRSLADGALSAVFLHLDPLKAQVQFGEQTVSSIMNAIGKMQHTASHIVNTISSQILLCPLKGQSRQLYMTGKALELMAYLLPEAGDNMDKQTKWSLRDIECFHAAKAILLADLANPPTVMELARMVGTNARKLGAGFSDIFGMPVYSYVKARRLEEARQLLEAGETSISRVAHDMGYNPAHFTTEFRKKFGFSPSQINRS